MDGNSASRHARSSRAFATALAGAGLAIVTPKASLAADAQPNQEAQPNQQAQPDQSAGLQEIVVTAQRRSEKLQDVPISAVVIDQNTRLGKNWNSLGDLSQTEPGVAIGSGGKSEQLYVRGIGSDQNQSFDQSVGVFVDGIYYGRSRMSLGSFLDLDHVEILKGPQSTYFGNNAIAGAFNILTAKPSDENTGWMRALYGMYGQYAVEGAGNIPLSDKVAVRIAATLNGEEGWGYNRYTHDHLPQSHNGAVRATILFRPADDLDATLKIEGGENRSPGPSPFQLVGCPPSEPFVAAGLCSVALELGVPTGLDNRQNASSDGQFKNLDSIASVLTINYHKWGHTFTSVTGFYNYHFKSAFDADQLPLTLLNVWGGERYNQFSQELRVASPQDQAIEYLAGAYVQVDKLFVDQSLNATLLNPVVSSIPPLAPLVPYLPLGQVTQFSQPEQTYSIFGAVTWHISDQIKLTAGLRGSWVHKSIDWDLHYGTATEAYGGIVPFPASIAALGNAFAEGAGLGVAASLNATRRDQAWMPSAKLQYQVAPTVMTYFSYAKGFKAGGFNGGDTTGQVSNLPFAPEYVDAYEVGIKSTLFKNKVKLNFDVFRSDYRNLQISTNNLTSTGGIIGIVGNAGAAKSQGVEFEGQWLISPSLQLAAKATYLDSHYIAYPNAGPTTLQQFFGINTQDLAGRPTQFAPRWSGSLTGSYKATLPGGYQLGVELSPYLSTSYYFTDTDDSFFQQDAYMRLDGRVSVESPDGHWGFDVIGKNMTNTSILVAGGSPPGALGSLELMKQRPVSVAAQIRYHW